MGGSAPLHNPPYGGCQAAAPSPAFVSSAVAVAGHFARACGYGVAGRCAAGGQAAVRPPSIERGLSTGCAWPIPSPTGSAPRLGLASWCLEPSLGFSQPVAGAIGLDDVDAVSEPIE